MKDNRAAEYLADMELETEIGYRFGAERHPVQQAGPEWGPNPYCPGDEHTDECPVGCVQETDGYSWERA